MKFRAPKGRGAIRVASTHGGHAAVVGETLRELPEFLHKAALEAGCVCDALPEGSLAAKPEATVEPSPRELIREALRAMVAEGNADDFTGNGLPDIRRTRGRLGFSAEKEAILSVWHELGEAA